LDVGEVLAKAPKNAPLENMLAVWDDIRTEIECLGGI
jgi:hypothetical protein